MSRTRPSRAAARTLRLLLLASLVMLGPLAATPSHAWTPPPAPLPIEPGDTDGIDDEDFELSRPRRPSDSAQGLGSRGAKGGRTDPTPHASPFAPTGHWIEMFVRSDLACPQER